MYSYIPNQKCWKTKFICVNKLNFGFVPFMDFFEKYIYRKLVEVVCFKVLKLVSHVIYFCSHGVPVIG